MESRSVTKVISKNFEDYEVLNILGATTYKVRDKKSGNIYICRATPFRKPSEIDTIINMKKENTHRHYVEVYDYIVKEDSGVIYVVTEYLENGNLNGIVQKCLIGNTHLHENFLWKILHQIASVLKTNMTAYMDLNNVFVTSDYNIKIYKEVPKDKKKLSVGKIMQNLSTLQIGKDTVDFPSHYTHEFKEMVKFLSTPGYTTKEIVDTILCHPTILVKSKNPQKMFVENAPVKTNDQKVNPSVFEIDTS